MTKPVSRLKIHLDVPYDYQLDNKTSIGRPHAECQTSTNYMLADYVTGGFISRRAEANGMANPVNWWATHVVSRGDTTDGGVHNRIWRDELGIESHIATDGTLDDLIDSLVNGQPKAIGVHYKSSGHWVLVVGVDIPNRMFRVHDPYGSRAGENDYYMSTDPVAGKDDYYSFNLMKRVWSNSEYQYRTGLSGDGYGWHRVIPKYIDIDQFGA